MTARNAILKAADLLFGEQGYGLVGVDALSKAAGVTKRTLYKQFGSKAGLFEAWLQRRDIGMREAMIGEVERRATQPRAQVLALFEVLGLLVHNPNFHGCPLSRALIELDASMNTSRAIAQAHKQAIRSWFTHQAERAQQSDIETLSEELLLLYEGVLQRIATSKTSDAAEAAIRIIEHIWPEN
jgi:AcrR family transcriptional regulator